MDVGSNAAQAGGAPTVIVDDSDADSDSDDANSDHCQPTQAPQPSVRMAPLALALL